MNAAHDFVPSRQAGMTLVELLVALVLALVLTAGMIQVFTGNRVTYEFNQGLSRIQENARFALDHIAYNARMAGYRGCIANVAVHNNLDAPSPFRDGIENGIQGYDYLNTGDGDSFNAVANPVPSTTLTNWSPNLPAELGGLVLPGSDVLVVRSLAGASRPLVSPFDDGSQLFVETPHGFLAGEILVATDCQKASIFQVTGIDAGGTNVVHADTGGFVPGNNFSDWPPEQEYGLGAELSRLQTFAFYVGRGANGQPALFQLRLARQSATSTGFQAEELVPGIESLQVRYGIDTDGDQAINDWVHADAVADWGRVISVEINLLARATEEYGTEVDDADYVLGTMTFNPVDDRRLRQVFSTTVGVRNRLP
ncbi:MAG TPA: PilW family protein [Woeseiaceae bacterium]|nr:PilW family protein [Woeseiaceae bacterium]